MAAWNNLLLMKLSHEVYDRDDRFVVTVERRHFHLHIYMRLNQDCDETVNVTHSDLKELTFLILPDLQVWLNQKVLDNLKKQQAKRKH